MSQIEITLKKQILTIQNREIISSGDVNYDTCLFTFDETWEGFTKTGVFYQDKSNVQYVVLDSNDICVIPAAAMTKEGKMYIGVFKEYHHTDFHAGHGRYRKRSYLR